MCCNLHLFPTTDIYGKKSFENVQNDPELRRMLWHLLGGTRGGENRARILHLLKKRPSNLNQIAKNLGLDYNAIEHHVGALRKNNLVIAAGERYGMTYFPSPWLEGHYEIFEEVCKGLHYRFED